jgi:hypothetical protein
MKAEGMVKWSAFSKTIETGPSCTLSKITAATAPALWTASIFSSKVQPPGELASLLSIKTIGLMPLEIYTPIVKKQNLNLKKKN